jgi:two-component system cell cycle sensor histidine kinase/response regulator CckA
MSIETQKNFLGKTQTLLMTEIQSEKWLSYVRLGIAGVYLIVVLFGFLAGTTSAASFIVQITSIGFLVSYSSYYLLHYYRRFFHSYFVYILISLDVAVITAILWSYNLNPGSGSLTGAAFGTYFVVITFTSLHHRTSLSLFCGALSILGYSLIFFSFNNAGPANHGLEDYFIRVILLMTVSGLGGIVSRNNSRTIKQVVSSEIKYHNLVHRLPEMLCTIDKQGNFLWSNMASNAILGVPSKVLTGQNLRNFLVNPESFKLDKSGIKGTFEILDFNGNHKFADCVIQQAEESGSAVFEGTITDVTDRELAISQREEMVSRLFQYQKMESLGTLASGMAHDFNNILQTVNDITATVERDSKEPETIKKMELINETMADARFLISELLALGRKKPLDYKSLNLKDFLTSIASHYAKQLGPNYTITLEASDVPIWVQGDPDYLKRVFQNLFGNARDAMPEGGNITVSVSNFNEDEGNGTAVIRVRDTGTGIPPELTEKIFDPFFTTKKPGKGTGLGLALVRRIIMLHSGTIFVETTGYEGTVFKIELPVSDESSFENDTKSILLNRYTSSILLLDDDPKIRDVLKFFLKELKYIVVESSNCQEAMQKLKANLDSCHVLIMDWKVGNEDPQQIIRTLREIKKELMVIVVSGYPPQQKSIESMQIQKWFTKPYDKNQLDIEIQRALHKSPTTKLDTTQLKFSDSTDDL